MVGMLLTDQLISLTYGVIPSVKCDDQCPSTLHANSRWKLQKGNPPEGFLSVLFTPIFPDN